jgi:hypothetical protein
MLLMKEQFVVKNTIRQNKVPELLDSCVTNTLRVNFWHRSFTFLILAHLYEKCE